MATKSFLKQVVIRKKSSGQRLISALEVASKKQGSDIKISRTVHRIDKENVKGFIEAL